ncbi:hypothetical protein HYH03_010769 [Edaphochlamys debaryana]|uniref:SHSP domain-containing protein n=1 Tax=Edaphochlamys debaryana TaxID=47281 RepID=A0A835XYP0_9CHLO|nr:hypothetical protein HYH03_010769 [Edaphochlamys debaryana]|eukprot:KAG2490851.1 hypothetical protein HYH03_010769 [Edaphochlamys debaryana]
MSLALFSNDPFVGSLDRVVGRMLNDFGMPNVLATPSGQRAAQPAGHLHLPTDIVETDKAFELIADAPGMSPEDLKVELHEGVLTMSGKRSVARDDKDASGKVWRSERTSYSFSRSFALPENAAPEGISATMDKGVLKVTVPKTEPAPKPEPKRITITAA